MLPTIIVDAHLDIAMNYVAHGRDFRDAAWVKRRRENKHGRFDGVGVATLGMPDMLLGRTGIAFASLWVPPKGASIAAPSLMYETPEQAYRNTMKQLDYYNRLSDEDERIRLIRTQTDLQEVLASWADDKHITEHKIGLVLSMEGADPILEPQQFEEWYERGVRIAGLAWEATRYSAGTGHPGRITNLGWELLDIMAGLNTVLDVSHLAEVAFYEALENYPGQIIATHSNPRHFAETDRNLTDDMIRRLVERDGVMGIVPFNEFTVQNWKSGRDHRAVATVRDVLNMIDHVCQVAGTARHVGLGTDWDGGFGLESIPLPFDSHSDLWQMRDFLANRGYDDSDITNILGHNFLRIIQQTLP